MKHPDRSAVVCPSVHVVYLIDSLSHGGAEQSLLSLAPSIQRTGIELEVVYLHERPGLQDLFTQHGIRIDWLGPANGISGRVLEIYRLLRTRRPDLLHTTLFEADVSGRLAARLAKIPVTSSVVNVGYSPPMQDPAYLRRLKAKRVLLLDRTSVRWTSRVHAISRATAHFACEHLHVPRDRIDVIPRGRDSATLGSRTPERRHKVRQTLGISRDAPVVLFAGRNEEQKGLDILLRAFPGVLHDCPNVHLVIAGRPARNVTITDQLASAVPADQLHVIGVRDDVPDLLVGCDVFVLPSRWEGLGSILLEAMALDTPIVASDLPATRELLEDGRTALLVPPADVDALRRAIICALVSTVDARERARRARSVFLDSYTSERIADSMALFWRRTLMTDPSPV